MNILILDDDSVRHEYFAERFRGHDVWHCYDVKRFRKLYLENDWDLVHLDHDLGTKETGMDAVNEMVRLKDLLKRPGRVIVHSWNPDGSKLMAATLHRHGFNVEKRMFEVKP
jgi:DNA-binding response OmpR family regulator